MMITAMNQGQAKLVKVENGGIDELRYRHHYHPS